MNVMQEMSVWLLFIAITHLCLTVSVIRHLRWIKTQGQPVYLKVDDKGRKAHLKKPNPHLHPYNPHQGGG